MMNLIIVIIRCTAGGRAEGWRLALPLLPGLPVRQKPAMQAECVILQCSISWYSIHRIVYCIILVYVLY